MGRSPLTPDAAKHIEWVGGNAADTVVCGPHDEFGTRSDGAEFPDNQPVPEFRIVEQDIVPLKACWIVGIVIIGVIAPNIIVGTPERWTSMEETRAASRVGSP